MFVKILSQAIVKNHVNIQLTRGLVATMLGNTPTLKYLLLSLTQFLTVTSPKHVENQHHEHIF